MKEFRQNNDTAIVLISGKAGTGKTTSAHLLEELTNELGFLDFITLSFASEIKRVAKECFTWDNIKDKSGRKLLQNLGQVGRAYNNTIWAEYLLRKIYDNPGMYDFVFIDDWRFPNEEAFLKKATDFEIITVRIYAPDREILKGTPEYNDVSETSLLDKPNHYDYYIVNDGTIPELRRKLAKMLIKIYKSQKED